MNNYKVPVYYQVCEYLIIRADSPEEARQWVEDNQDKIPTHPDRANYIDDSYEVESDPGAVFMCERTAPDYSTKEDIE